MTPLPTDTRKRDRYIRSLIALLLTYWSGDIEALCARIRAAQKLPGYGMPDLFTGDD